MAIQFVLTEDAEHDLENTLAYLANRDSPRAAEHVLNRVLEVADSLMTAPTRGTAPQVLRGLGDQEFRQVFFKPYRLIYRLIGQQVFIIIYLIADGRMHMQSLLARRLLGG